MRIEQWDPADVASAQRCHEAWHAAKHIDDPLRMPKSVRAMRGWMKCGFDGDPGEVWLVPGEPHVDAWYRLGLPERANRGSASLHIVVRPAARRRGLGTELLRHAMRRAQANHRIIIKGDVLEGSPGEAFARQAGVRFGLKGERRLLDVATVTAGRVAELRAHAVSRAPGYSLVYWAGATPDEYVNKVAPVQEAMNDAPDNEDAEAEVWDADRIREVDATLAIFGFRAYSIGAVHDASGEMVALTQVFADPEFPEWAHQGFTAVTRAHRGHRLGLLVKAAMLEWLAKAEPQVKHIDTGNAASNKHMIAVNELLGYRIHASGWVCCELPVLAQPR